MTPGDAVYRRSPDVRFRAVADETVVIRQDAAEALVLNEVAGRVLELVDGQRTVADLVDVLASEFDVESDTLEGDIPAYLRELAEIGLIYAV